jgi:hypothetical protein
LLACTFNVFFHYGRLHQVNDDRAVAGVTWKQASSEIDNANSLSTKFTTEDQQLVGQLGRTTAIGEELVGNADRRVLWLEMLKTVNSSLPQTPGVQPGEIPDVDKLPFHQRQEIHVDQLEVQFFEKLEDWFAGQVKNRYIETQKSLGGQAASSGTTDTTAAAAGPKGPSAEGWVVQLQCYHYFNQDLATQGITHANKTLIYNLQHGSIVMPVAVDKIRPGVMVSHQVQPPSGQVQFMNLRVASIVPTVRQDPATGADAVSGYQLTLQGVENPIAVPTDGRVPVVFTMQEMGIDYPLVLDDAPINPTYRVPNPNFEIPESGYPGGSNYPGTMGGPGGAMGRSGMMGTGMGVGMGASMGAGMSPDSGLGASPGSGGSKPPAGTGGGSSGAGGDKDNEPQEPPYLTVPRYDFTVQFVWKEILLSERLEKQANDWQKEQQQQGTQPAAGADLAANTKGGA